MYRIVLRVAVVLAFAVPALPAAACGSGPEKADEPLAACPDTIAGAFAQTGHLTLISWTACPTIQQTNDMLVFDGYSALCEAVKAGARVIVDRAEQAPATRWLCIDHPAANGTFTLCKWETFQDEPKMCCACALQTKLDLPMGTRGILHQRNGFGGHAATSISQAARGRDTT
jgi:hypothetical protein